MIGANVWQDDSGQHFTDCMADGPRYRMLGNSMAVPVIRWILSRVPASDDAAFRAEGGA